MKFSQLVIDCELENNALRYAAKVHGHKKRPYPKRIGSFFRYNAHTKTNRPSTM